MSQRTLGIVAAAGAFVCALLVILSGCGVQNGPSTARPDGSADAQFFLDQSAGHQAQAQGIRGNAGSIPATPMVLSRSFQVDGSAGAELAFGRFALSIPPGAFEGWREITIEAAANGYVECRLYPEGLQFDLPVTLTMDLANSSADGLGATIYWYDPRCDFWVDLGGTYLVSEHAVSVQLEHFSTYRGGRAGW